MSKEFLHNFPPHLLTDRMRNEALDIEFHWVNETGTVAICSAGAKIEPTVSSVDLPSPYAHANE